jgi:hypothetical protein
MRKCMPTGVPPHGLEPCSSAPEADALSTELRGQTGRILPLDDLRHCDFALGASKASSLRKFVMMPVLPRSSPNFRSCSFL